ncbi:tetraspanin Pls1 family [Clavulina sp. PMI_390]|nr:tetraspanin Pls1 family [Clavulina sp. PMI_390]
MPSRSLNYIWAGLDFALLAAGIISIVFSVMWRNSTVLMNFILFDLNLTMGTILGVMFLLTFVISLFAITQRKPLTMGLKVLNWALVADSFAVLVIGSIIWFYSLKEPTNYQKVWIAQPENIQTQLQDMFSCCGYFNASNIALGGSFCGTNNATASAQIGCETAVVHAADYAINNIFTTIYGFMAITLSLILASLCQINLRVEEDRFRRIDEKRGGQGGFV